MSKELKAYVKLDTKSAEASLKRLYNQIDRVQKAVNTGAKANNGLTNSINKSCVATQRLSGLVNKVNRSQNQLTRSVQRTNQAYSQSGSLIDSLSRKVRGLAAAYLGVMGAKAAINASDTITGAENKLNNINAQQIQNAGGNAYTDTGYSQQVLKQTQNDLDKIYTSAQKVRVGYDDMISNVGKSMMLAGDAFNNNIDAAIRFQEVMGEAYAISGASAAEQASSMYQLIQALGSGILQGDELRSVREGAALAYKEIEKYAQGVLNTKESLKELASQGLITSDIVVKAMLNAGDAMDKAFANTKITFAQAFTMLKNSAIKAFEPVLQQLNAVLNSDAGKAAIQGLTNAMYSLAGVIGIVINAFSIFFNWCYENWSWLSLIVYLFVGTTISLLTVLAFRAIWAGIQMFKAFILGMSPLQWFFVLAAAVITAIVWIANTASSGAEFIARVCLLLAQIIIGVIVGVLIIYIATGVIMGNVAVWVALAIIAVVLIIVGLIAVAGAEIVGFIFQAVQAVINVFIGLFNILATLIKLWVALVQNEWEFVINLAFGLKEAVLVCCDNIGIAWNNMCAGIESAFWNAIANCLEALGPLIEGLNGILKVAGMGTIPTPSSIRAKASAAAGKKQSYKSVSSAFKSGFNPSYNNLGEVAKNGMNTFSYGSLSDAYNKGYSIGESWQNSINSFGDKIKGYLNIGNLSGTSLPTISTDFGDFGNFAAPSSDGKSGKGGSGGDGGKVGKNTGKTADNTGKIADSMELTEEDLKYLRQLADREWKKEFTTANITVDMSNYNTINNGNDLDGIVTKLTDKLYEELNAVADGVYV